MAYAMISGILAGAVLTLTFLPALYVAAYRIKPSPRAPQAEVAPETSTPASADRHAA